MENVGRGGERREERRGGKRQRRDRTEPLLTRSEARKEEQM